MSKPVMISISGIRGVVGDGLTPQLILRYASAAGTFYGEGEVMVGRDSRVTGEMIQSAVFSGLMSVGCHPVDLGVCPTPTVQMAVERSDAVGGIAVTASHNPVEWNALKLVGPNGLFLDYKQGEQVQQIAKEESFSIRNWDGVGHSCSYSNAISDHLDAIYNLSYVDVDAIRNRKFNVALDCVNGAGGTIMPKLLSDLGCTVHAINTEPSGRFAHTPEPVPENLTDLCRLVRETKSDIGLAVDPDVDRLALVTEQGECMGEEYTITLAVKLVLSKTDGTAVVNVSTTQAVNDVASKSGAEVIRTPVGEIYVAKRMRELNAVIGGEGNGGVILTALHLGRDAPLATALTLQHLLEFGGSASALWNSLPRYVMSKKKVDIGSADPDQIISRLEENHTTEMMDKTDGLKILRQGKWVHIRKSNTEPIIRVMAEARTQDAAEHLVEELLTEISKLARS